MITSSEQFEQDFLYAFLIEHVGTVIIFCSFFMFISSFPRIQDLS